MKLERKLGVNLPPPVTEVRGQITGFSDKAARRLREDFMTLFVPGADLWAVTLTTHAVFTPVEWRGVMKRFRMAAKRAGWAGLWRVELQKRQAPHAHVAFWLPPSVTLADLSAVWLSATGEHLDPAAVAHAVVGRRIPHDETGWAVYLALHDGKRKEAQLGWLGKQWGVWNRSAFVTREPERFELNAYEHGAFLRILRKLDRSAREALALAEWRRQLAGPVSLVQVPVLLQNGTTALQFEVRACPGSSIILTRDPFRRPRLRGMHRGNLLRCVKGEVVARIVHGLTSGAIGRNQAPF